MAPSPMYSKLLDTATECINSTTFDRSNPSAPISFDRARAIRTSDYTHKWGHKSALAGTPLSHTLTVDGFLEHLGRMSPMLANVQHEIHDIWIDEERKAATVKMTYRMSAKSEPETVLENEMLWVLEMEESGERVKSGVEWLDMVTSGKLREIVMRGVKEQQEKSQTQ